MSDTNDCSCYADYDSVTGETHWDECDDCFYARKGAEEEEEGEETEDTMIIRQLLKISPKTIEDKLTHLIKLFLLVISVPSYIATNPSIRRSLIALVQECKEEAFQEELHDMYAAMDEFMESLTERTDYIF
jgi:hypothetical protein